jgi:cell division protein FtsB
MAAFALVGLMLYFAFHAFAGENGLGKWSDMQARLAEKEAELARLEADIKRLEREIDRLTPGRVDPDYLELLAREKLAFVYPDELVLITDE